MVVEESIVEGTDGGPVQGDDGDAGGHGPGEDLDLVRELARKAYADAIPELIDGRSVGEIMASVEGARAAYARVFQLVATRQVESVNRPPTVPAGGSSKPVFDLERLPAAEKLRRGVSAEKR